MARDHQEKRGRYANRGYGTELHTYLRVYQRAGVNRTKIRIVTLELKRPAALAGLSISVFAALVAALLWLMPKPATRFEYMIAGTAATAVTLLVLFLVLAPGARKAFRRLLSKNRKDAAIPRTSQKSEKSS